MFSLFKTKFYFKISTTDKRGTFPDTIRASNKEDAIHSMNEKYMYDSNVVDVIFIK
jgi:hypothetical protein